MFFFAASIIFSAVLGPIPDKVVRSSTVSKDNLSIFVSSAFTSVSIVLSLSPSSFSRISVCLSILSLSSRFFCPSDFTSICQPVSFAASLTLCPFLPIAKNNISSATKTSAFFSSSEIINTEITFAGDIAPAIYFTGSKE